MKSRTELQVCQAASSTGSVCSSCEVGFSQRSPASKLSQDIVGHLVSLQELHQAGAWSPASICTALLAQAPQAQSTCSGPLRLSCFRRVLSGCVCAEPLHAVLGCFLHLQKELAELWAASKPATGNSLHKDHSQQLQQQPAAQDAVARLESSQRKSNDKRKLSSERKPSSDLSISSQVKGGDAVGGSHDSAAGLWSTQAASKFQGDHGSACGGDSTPCLRWFPYKVCMGACGSWSLTSGHAVCRTADVTLSMPLPALAAHSMHG